VGKLGCWEARRHVNRKGEGRRQRGRRGEWGTGIKDKRGDEETGGWGDWEKGNK